MNVTLYIYIHILNVLSEIVIQDPEAFKSMSEQI